MSGRMRAWRRIERVRVDHCPLTTNESESDGSVVSFNQHGPIVTIVPNLAARHRGSERVNVATAQSVHEVGDAVFENPLILVIMTGQDGAGSPGGIGPLHHQG